MLGRVKRAEGANPPADYAEGVQMGLELLEFLKRRKNISHDGSIHKMALLKALFKQPKSPNIEELANT